MEVKYGSKNIKESTENDSIREKDIKNSRTNKDLYADHELGAHNAFYKNKK